MVIAPAVYPDPQKWLPIETFVRDAFLHKIWGLTCWGYDFEPLQTRRLPERPIPRIEFSTLARGEGLAQVKGGLDIIFELSTFFANGYAPSRSYLLQNQDPMGEYPHCLL